MTTARDIRARFEAAGYPVLMGGKIGASTEFYYLDTEPVMKVIVELAGGSPADLEPIATYPRAPDPPAPGPKRLAETLREASSSASSARRIRPAGAGSRG